MGYRGRLIWKFYADLAQFNATATAANGAALPHGYDYDFKEPVKFSDGTDARVYDAPVRLPCQVETEGMDPFERLQMMNLGQNEPVELKLVFHFKDLEDRAMVTANGRATIAKGDRLVAVYDDALTEVDDYGSLNLHVSEVEPRSYGLSGLKRNLLLVTFRKRDYGTTEV